VYTTLLHHLQNRKLESERESERERERETERERVVASGSVKGREC
jgi:hypothetical protein